MKIYKVPRARDQLHVHSKGFSPCLVAGRRFDEATVTVQDWDMAKLAVSCENNAIYLSRSRSHHSRILIMALHKLATNSPLKPNSQKGAEGEVLIGSSNHKHPRLLRNATFHQVCMQRRVQCITPISYVKRFIFDQQSSVQ